jgi:hypothetical protein
VGLTVATNVMASTDRIQSATGYLGHPDVVIESGHRWG